jgi:uncharacterized repeat protein (TIGR03803 family)
MNTRIKIPFLLPGLIACLGLMFTGRVSAQTFTNLYYFSTGLTNQDGAQPSGSLILLGNTLYGTAGIGGTNGNGSIFAVNTNGTSFTNFHSFSARAKNSLGHATNSDGTGPTGGLILSGSLLYGTAFAGGTNGNGTVFALNTNSTGFTILYHFSAGATNALGHLTNSDGATPYTGLILSGTTLYGTACYGGTNGNGTVFALNTNGAGFTTLHNFTTLVASNNSDGANPYAGLMLSGSTLYGTTQFGGTNGTGTLFALNTNGTGFTNLHNFSVQAPNALNHITNSDGAITRARLILSGNTLYGTATFGGTNSYGTVFALDTNGTGFTILHHFSAGATNALFTFTNSDGAYPQGGVILSGNTLYGAAEYGGSLGLGTIYSVNTNGGRFTVLEAFPVENFNLNLLAETNSIGAYPQSALMLSDNTLFGSAPLGAIYGSGTLFSLSLGPFVSQPPLVISRSGTNVLVMWPTNFTGFTLQSTTNLLSPEVWSTVSPAPAIVGGQYIVTNGNSGSSKFYRLSQ